MNDNYNGDRESQGKESAEKERIRFDSADFENPYSKYYSEQKKEREQFGSADFENPYSRYYSGNKDDKADNENGGDTSENGEKKGAHGADCGPCSIYKSINIEVDPALIRARARIKNDFSRIGRGYAILSAVTFAVSMIIAWTVRYVDPDFYASSLFMNLLTPISLYVFALPALLIAISGCAVKAPEKRRMGFGEWLLFLIASFGCMYLGSLIGNNLMDFLSRFVGYDYSNGLNSIIDGENLIMTAIFTVVIAPLGEELVFRKLIIDRTAKYGPFISIGLSALIFALMHANLYQFFYCLLIGIILGYMYYTTGKLYLTVAIHAAVNFVGSIVTSWLSPITNALLTADPNDPAALLGIVAGDPLGFFGLIVFDLFVYGAMACAVIFPIAFRKRLQGRLVPGEVQIPRHKTVQTVILNGGMIAMLAVYFFEFGLNLLPI